MLSGDKVEKLLLPGSGTERLSLGHSPATQGQRCSPPCDMPERERIGHGVDLPAPNPRQAVTGSKYRKFSPLKIEQYLGHIINW